MVFYDLYYFSDFFCFGYFIVLFCVFNFVVLDTTQKQVCEMGDYINLPNK